MIEQLLPGKFTCTQFIFVSLSVSDSHCSTYYTLVYWLVQVTSALTAAFTHTHTHTHTIHSLESHSLFSLLPLTLSFHRTNLVEQGEFELLSGESVGK